MFNNSSVSRHFSEDIKYFLVIKHSVLIIMTYNLTLRKATEFLWTGNFASKFFKEEGVVSE